MCHISHIELVKGASWSSLGRLSTRSDKWVSVHGGWLCFRGQMYAIGYIKNVNMVQGQQAGQLLFFLMQNKQEAQLLRSKCYIWMHLLIFGQSHLYYYKYR